MEFSSGKSEKPIEISIILPTNAYFLSGIRDFTLTLAKNLSGFSDQWAYRCQAVIDELCNNAIEHGSQSDDTIKITFLSLPSDYIEFQVEDHGSGKNSLNAKQMNDMIDEKIRSGVSATNVGFRGRGLSHIVAKWTDELEFIDLSPHGLKVRARKYLKNNENGPEKTPLTKFHLMPHFALQ
ncbi:ATP-binding protein [Candidatus Peregrinibacteria bacterium]|nr:ATP-binding protein [Candidatus Peregrinibacteria bacterium]